jgi:hypothetical protein
MVYPTDNTLERLRDLLNIPALGGEDWDLVFADSQRLSEFCDAYEKGSLNADEKTALMELIVASYDNHLSEVDAQVELESRVTKLLERDFELHRHTIEYWSALKSYNPENLWAVSPLMRKILVEHSSDA